MRWRRWRPRGHGFDDKNSTTALKGGSRGGIFTWLHVLKSEILTPETAVMKQMQRMTRMDSLQGGEARAMTSRCRVGACCDNQNLEFRL